MSASTMRRSARLGTHRSHRKPTNITFREALFAALAVAVVAVIAVALAAMIAPSNRGSAALVPNCPPGTHQLANGQHAWPGNGSLPNDADSCAWQHVVNGQPVVTVING
jgi:invasion protein IalB